MEIILREHVDNLGRRGDVVKVAAGYARNYLLPRKLALAVNEDNKRQIERERKNAEARELEEKSQAEAFAQRLAQTDISIARRVGENNTLYGSVTSADIARRSHAKGFEIDKRKITLAEPLKALGEVTRAGQDPPRRDRASEGQRRRREAIARSDRGFRLQAEATFLLDCWRALRAVERALSLFLDQSAWPTVAVTRTYASAQPRSGEIRARRDPRSTTTRSTRPPK